MQPYLNRILIEEIAAQPKVRASGLEVPDTAEKEKAMKGLVLAVGDNVQYAKVGQRIVFKKYAPETFEEEGKKYLVIEEDDVLVIL